MLPIAEQLAIVLVEPQSPGNVGMVCRAMKNMGLQRLRLVNPRAYDHPEAYKFAVSARDLLEGAEVYADLPAALADTPLSVATTRRHGKYRQEIINAADVPDLLAPHLVENRAAIVFGREDSGLTTDEVAVCRWHATIATGDPYGSLNLAQAVLIFCYELCRGFAAPLPVGEPRQLASVPSLEELYAQMQATLLRIGYLKEDNPEHMMRSLRRIFARAQLDSREVAALRGLFSQVDWAADNFRGRK